MFEIALDRYFRPVLGTSSSIFRWYVPEYKSGHALEIGTSFNEGFPANTKINPRSFPKQTGGADTSPPRFLRVATLPVVRTLSLLLLQLLPNPSTLYPHIWAVIVSEAEGVS